MYITKKIDTSTHQMLQGGHSVALLDKVQSYNHCLGIFLWARPSFPTHQSHELEHRLKLTGGIKLLMKYA